MVSLLQRVLFSNAKREPKGFAPAYGASLRLRAPPTVCRRGERSRSTSKAKAKAKAKRITAFGKLAYIRKNRSVTSRLTGKPAPTGLGVHLQVIGRLSGCLRGQASLLQGVRCTRFALHHSSGRALARLQLGRHRWQASSHRVRCTSAKKWSAVRPPSRAGSLLQWNVCTCKRLVGCQAAFAGKPRSYKGFGVNASLFTTHQAER